MIPQTTASLAEFGRVFDDDEMSKFPVDKIPAEIQAFVDELMATNTEIPADEAWLRLGPDERWPVCPVTMKFLDLLRRKENATANATAALLRAYDEWVTERVMQRRPEDALLTDNVMDEAIAMQAYRLIEAFEPRLSKRLHSWELLNDVVADAIMHHLRLEKRIAGFFRDRLLTRPADDEWMTSVCDEARRLWLNLRMYGVPSARLRPTFARIHAWMRVGFSDFLRVAPPEEKRARSDGISHLEKAFAALEKQVDIVQ